METGDTGFVPELAPSLSSLASVGQIPSEVIADGFQPPTVPLAPPMATPTTLLPPHGPPAANEHAILPQTQAQLPAGGGEEVVVPASESTDSPSLIPSVPSYPEPSHLPTDDVVGGDAMPSKPPPVPQDEEGKGEPPVAPVASPALTATLTESKTTPTATPPTTSLAAEDELKIPERSRTPPPESVAKVTEEGAAVPGEAESEREETQPAAAKSTPQPSPTSSPKPPTEVCN